MTDWTALTLPEQTLLLAVHDDRGTLHPSHVRSGLGCAIVAELLLRERIIVVQEESHSDSKVLATDVRPTDDPVLDEVLERITSDARPGSLLQWITTAGERSGLSHTIAEHLVELGILERTEGRTLWIFPRVTYPTADPAPERTMVEAITEALGGDAPVETRLGVLIALSMATGILRHAVPLELLEERHARIEEIREGLDVPPALRNAIRSMEDVLSAGEIGGI